MNAYSWSMRRICGYYEDKLNDLSYDLTRLMKTRAVFEGFLKSVQSVQKGSEAHTDILEEIQKLEERISQTHWEMKVTANKLVKYSEEENNNG